MLFISGSKNSSGKAATHSRFPQTQAERHVNQPFHCSATGKSTKALCLWAQGVFPVLLSPEVAWKHPGNSSWSLLEMQERCPKINSFCIIPKATGIIENNIWRGKVQLSVAQPLGPEKHWVQVHHSSHLSGHKGWNRMNVCLCAHVLEHQGLCRGP